MDFKEVKKKDGSVLVFCNFEELLKEFYGVKTMAEVERNLSPTGEYIIHCPFCKEEGHTKHKLYIKSDLTVGHCFVCTRSFINVTEEINTSIKTENFFPCFNNAKNGLNLVKLSDPVWTLDRFKYEFDSFDKKGYDYLVGRHKYLSELYKILGFKFLDGNIVMPFKYHDEIFYYQIRFSNKNSKIRYFFPPISAKPPYIIEHGDNKNFIICEGIFDAISLLIQAPDYTPCAVMGSSISNYQIEFLREYIPENILVYMDDTQKSKGIASKLSSVIDYCPIHIIKSDGTDPEENMIKRMDQGLCLQWIK